MKFPVTVIVAIACISSGFGQEILVQRVNGEVTVRHGVTEAWLPVNSGVTLKSDATVRTGKQGSAVLATAVLVGDEFATRRLALPPEVVIDLSDLKELTREELMLKLTMERVRATPYEWKNKDLRIPNAGVVHGDDRTPSAPLTENDPETGRLQLNGTRLLFDNGFYSTCALKTLETLRLYPSLANKFENRLLVAESLEKARLNGEALNEFALLSTLETATPAQRAFARSKMESLRNQSDR